MDKIYGRMPVLEALKSQRPIDRVYMQDSLSGEFEREVRARCRALDIPLSKVPKERLDVAIKGNHQGIYALTALVSYVDLEERLQEVQSAERPAIFLLLDGIMDVRNLGAIARTAEVFGVDALVLPSRGTAPVNEDAVKASAGALAHVPLCRVRHLLGAVEYLAANGVAIAGAGHDAAVPVGQVDLTVPVAIVMGSEDRGIDRNLKVYLDSYFHIPQVGKTQSLNVSVAAGIILYELCRQRQ